MKSLFISTYNENIIVGLYENDTLVDSITKYSDRGHSVYLVPSVDELLKRNNISTEDLNEIYVVNGPGSFTGIRLGITVAKTLAYTLNIPIKTITSLDAISAGIELDNKIITITDAKGKYIAVYENNKLKDDYIYLKSEDAKNFISSVGYEEFENSEINLDKIKTVINNIEATNAHAVKAIYIKEIDVLNGR